MRAGSARWLSWISWTFANFVRDIAIQNRQLCLVGCGCAWRSASDAVQPFFPSGIAPQGDMVLVMWVFPVTSTMALQAALSPLVIAAPRLWIADLRIVASQSPRLSGRS